MNSIDREIKGALIAVSHGQKPVASVALSVAQMAKAIPTLIKLLKYADLSSAKYIFLLDAKSGWYNLEMFIHPHLIHVILCQHDRGIKNDYVYEWINGKLYAYSEADIGKYIKSNIEEGD